MVHLYDSITLWDSEIIQKEEEDEWKILGYRMSAVKDYLPGMIVSFHTHSYQLLLHVQDLVKPEKKKKIKPEKKKKETQRGSGRDCWSPSSSIESIES